MSTTYYTSYTLNYEEQFSHKEFSHKMVIEQLQFCKQNGKIEEIGFDDTELRGNVSFLAKMDNGEKRFYRFYNGNQVARNRLFHKFSRLVWGMRI